MNFNQIVNPFLRCFICTHEGCNTSQTEEQVHMNFQLLVTFLINIMTGNIAKDFGIGELKPLLALIKAQLSFIFIQSKRKKVCNNIGYRIQT
jgi:hypothetical protein